MKKRNFKILFIVSLVAFTIVISQVIIYAAKSVFLEPKENIGKTPKNLVWNQDRGEYYDPTEFEWDSQNNKYVAKFLEKKAVSGTVLSQGEEQRIWFEKNKNSKNPLDVALVNYFKYISSPNQPNALSSKYEPQNDEGLKYLTDLGDEYAGIMIERIEKNDIWAGTLMSAVEKIKKIEIPHEYKDASPEGTKKWVGYVKEKIK